MFGSNLDCITQQIPLSLEDYIGTPLACARGLDTEEKIAFRYFGCGRIYRLAHVRPVTRGRPSGYRS